MQGNRRRDTAPEMEIRRLLHGQGLRYRVDLPLPFDRRGGDTGLDHGQGGRAAAARGHHRDPGPSCSSRRGARLVTGRGHHTVGVVGHRRVGDVEALVEIGDAHVVARPPGGPPVEHPRARDGAVHEHHGATSGFS